MYRLFFKIYLKNNPIILYIRFFLDKLIGIIKNAQIVKKTIENNLCDEKANNIKNVIINIPYSVIEISDPKSSINLKIKDNTKLFSSGK